MLEVCEQNVQDPERFAQAGVGWVPRSLSDTEPNTVFHFIGDHQNELNREAIRMATAQLVNDQRAALAIMGTAGCK